AHYQRYGFFDLSASVVGFGRKTVNPEMSPSGGEIRRSDLSHLHFIHEEIINAARNTSRERTGGEAAKNFQLLDQSAFSRLPIPPIPRCSASPHGCRVRHETRGHGLLFAATRRTR